MIFDFYDLDLPPVVLLRDLEEQTYVVSTPMAPTSATARRIRRPVPSNGLGFG